MRKLAQFFLERAYLTTVAIVSGAVNIYDWQLRISGVREMFGGGWMTIAAYAVFALCAVQIIADLAYAIFRPKQPIVLHTSLINLAEKIALFEAQRKTENIRLSGDSRVTHQNETIMRGENDFKPEIVKILALADSLSIKITKEEREVLLGNYVPNAKIRILLEAAAQTARRYMLRSIPLAAS